MESNLGKLVEGFGTNPIASGKTMRQLVDADPKQFFEESLPLLRTAPDKPGFYYLLALLQSHELILATICDPAMFTVQESIALAKRLVRVEPLFDVKLAKTLLSTETDVTGKEVEQKAQSPKGLRLLEIMAVVSEGSRAPVIAQLLDHPDARVRSKAALLVGKSNKNVNWVKQRMDQQDSRIRANVVEALWGVESDGSRGVFWSALGDPDNRVVGNAILGLYRMGDPATIGLILQMINHPEEDFQKTGVWVMGETGDLRFLPVLARMMAEPTAALRNHVFRAVAKLKQKHSRLAAQRGLKLHAMPGAELPGGFREICVSVLSGAGLTVTGLKPTQFVVREAGELVTAYDVREEMLAVPLSAAFVMPRIVGRTGAQEIYERAFADCMRLKRKSDAWTIVKYLLKADAAAKAAADEMPAPPESFGQESAAALLEEPAPAPEFRFIVDLASIEDAVSAPGNRAAAVHDIWEAAARLVPALARTRGGRHLILFDDETSDDPDPAGLQDTVHRARMGSIAIHGFGRRPALRAACSNTGGKYLEVTGPESVPELLESLYAHLTATYHIRYRGQGLNVGELKIEVCADRGLGEVTVQL